MCRRCFMSKAPSKNFDLDLLLAKQDTSSKTRLKILKTCKSNWLVCNVPKHIYAKEFRADDRKWMKMVEKRMTPKVCWFRSCFEHITIHIEDIFLRLIDLAIVFTQFSSSNFKWIEFCKDLFLRVLHSSSFHSWSPPLSHPPIHKLYIVSQSRSVGHSACLCCQTPKTVYQNPPLGVLFGGV